MKFAHLADVHIGGWQDPKLRILGLEAFKKVIDICIKENTAFVLIAGDLFNTALPSIDSLKDVARFLRRLKKNNISVYVVPGSHDFSPSGKSMIDVLEKAGLLINVMKIKDNKLIFTKDKTGIKITGILGLRAGLEKEYFKTLNFSDLEKENGFKIFIFHCPVNEYKPKYLEKVYAPSINSFPKNFDYYAGGHVHYLLNVEYGRGILSYPGPLFPNNFKELEELKEGSFNLIDIKDDKIVNFDRVPIKIIDIRTYFFNADDKNPLELEREILHDIKDFEDKIILIRIEGKLINGKISDINFKDLFNNFKGAYAVLKNTNKLISEEFQDINIDENIEVTERRIIEEHLKNIGDKGEYYDLIINNLLFTFNTEKGEGEKVIDFENRLIDETIKSLKIKSLFEK